MNELFFLLIESMREEAACYRRLTLLAQEQKEMLITGNVSALPENLRVQEKQVFVLSPIKGRREEILSKLETINKVKKMDLNEAVRKSPVEMAEAVNSELNELIQAAKELASVHDVAGKLLNNAIDFTNFTLKAIREGGKKKSISMTVTAEAQRPSFVNRVV